MNQRCLYCYGELEQGELYFHEGCAAEIFGSSVPSFPLGGAEQEKFLVKGPAQGYDPILSAVAMRMARAALILTQPSTLLPTSDGGVVYLMRPDAAAEGMDRLVERLEGCEFDGSVEMIGELVEEFSSIARLDIVTLFEQVIFAWVAGCNAMTLSSFSLSRPNAGVCSLSSMYDLVPTLPLGEGVESALEINGKCRGISRRDFEASMRSFGLKDRIIRITIEKMIKSEEKWQQIIATSPLSDPLKGLYAAFIAGRVKVLKA